MTYTAEISRTNPSCFLFLIDQSGSMQDRFGEDDFTKTKADSVADAINRLLQNLSIKCAKSEGVRDYYYVSVIGYGAKVGPAFTGPLSGKELVPISEIANHPTRIEERTKRVEDGAGGLVEKTIKLPIWFEPVSNGGTPMCEVFRASYSVLKNWLDMHPEGFPPIVINITDGESTDGDPSSVAESIKQLSTNDGNVLLFNLHLSSSRATPIHFPDYEQGLPDDYARLLFRLSSVLPQFMRNYAKQDGFSITDNSRGFVFNSYIEGVIRFLDIGTRPSMLR